MISIILVLLFTLCCAYFFAKRMKQGKYPPGPFSWPIIGNLHQLSEESYIDFNNLAKSYGNIFSIKLGSFNVVILNDYKDIKWAVGQQEVSGRPQFPHLFDPDTKLSTGLIWSEGRNWEEQRRFVIKNLRDFGIGKKSMEIMLQEEIGELVESLRKDVGIPICTTNRFNTAVFNSLWRIVALLCKFSSSTASSLSLIQKMTDISKDAKSFAFLGYFPWLSKLFPGPFGLNNYMANSLPIYNFMKSTVKSHEETFQDGQIRDLLDCYLRQIKNTTDSNSSFYRRTGESNLHMVLYDLFFGGTETTSVTLSWTFLLLAHHPRIQEKLHEEISRVIGNSRLPSLSDKPNAPYVDAVILEVMRTSSLVPIMLRRAVKDVELSGFAIPKGTMIYSNFHAVHHNKELWGDPENFRPERYLNDNGHKLHKTEYLLPFGSGKRVCPGESLARDQLFLFVTSLFQNFRVTLDPNDNSQNIEIYKGTLLRLPKPHKIILLDRHRH